MEPEINEPKIDIATEKDIEKLRAKALDLEKKVIRLELRFNRFFPASFIIHISCTICASIWALA